MHKCLVLITSSIFYELLNNEIFQTFYRHPVLSNTLFLIHFVYISHVTDYKNELLRYMKLIIKKDMSNKFKRAWLCCSLIN